MKKKFAVILAALLLLCLTLSACGGPDLEAASAAYTKTSTAFNDVAIYMNENPGAFSDEEIDVMTNVANALEETKATLESSDVTQEQADEAVEWLNAVYDNVIALKEAYGLE